jgi:hypothetical protein
MVTDATDALEAALSRGCGPAPARVFGFTSGAGPVHGIRVSEVDTPPAHWHYVTYGRSRRRRPPFELSFRLARAAGEDEPPGWSLNFLKNVSGVLAANKAAVEHGHPMSANGRIALNRKTLLVAIVFALDPILGVLDVQGQDAPVFKLWGSPKTSTKLRGSGDRQDS